MLLQRYLKVLDHPLLRYNRLKRHTKRHSEKRWQLQPIRPRSSSIQPSNLEEDTSQSIERQFFSSCTNAADRVRSCTLRRQADVHRASRLDRSCLSYRMLSDSPNRESFPPYTQVAIFIMRTTKHTAPKPHASGKSATPSAAGGCVP